MKKQIPENYGTPLVSVVMPAYNSAQYIQQSIVSVQKQSLENWELLVIDDASSDETAQIVLDFARKDSRIKLHANRTNMGTAWCRNHGMNMSRGKAIAYLDSDDIWYPEKLERQIAFLEQKNADLVYCAYGYMDDSGKRSRNCFQVPEQATLEQMLRKNVIGCSTVMLTKDIAAHFRFSEQYHSEDYVLWLSLLKEGKRLCGINEVLADYRIRKNSRGSNKLLCAGYRWQVYREFMRFSRMKSLYYQIQYAAAGIMKYINI